MTGDGTARKHEAAEAVLSVHDLVVEFPVGRGEKVHAVSGLDLELQGG